MNHFYRFLSILLVALSGWLASCGSSLEAVTSVSAQGLRYTGGLVVVTLHLTGDALTAAGIQVYANGGLCTKDSSTSEQSRYATCILVVPDSLQVNVRIVNSSLEEVYNKTLSAPMPQVTFQTSMGTFVMELDPTKAPITVKNFLSYVHQSPSFYNGTLFHRIPTAPLVVQGGGFTSGMTPKTGLSPAITLESNNGLTNDRGTVAMARTDTPNSATSQFYVNLINNTNLNYVDSSSPGYAVFGKVVSGMEVIDTMATQTTHPVTANGTDYRDVPVTDITVTAATQTQ